jgi:hypothetical protein
MGQCLRPTGQSALKRGPASVPFTHFELLPHQPHWASCKQSSQEECALQALFEQELNSYAAHCSCVGLSSAPTTAPATTPAPTTTTAELTTTLPLSYICSSAESCDQCTSLPECGWCALEGRCVVGDKLSPTHEQCAAYEFNSCSNKACNAHSSCDDCLQDAQCGWCGSNSKCVKGTEAGPLFNADCPVGLKHWPIDWMHSNGKLKCGTNLGLHNGALWNSLRTLMDASKARTARLEGTVATPITYAPTEPPTTPPPLIPSLLNPSTIHNEPAPARKP